MTGAQEDQLSDAEPPSRAVSLTESESEPLTEQRAAAHVHGICFKTGPPGRVGVELEWLVHDAGNPSLPVPPERVAAALDGLDRPGALPARGCLTTEPGGQLELSSLPATSIGDCWMAATRDLAAIREAMQDAGLCLAGHGLDPFRPPVRFLDQPRYVAMEEFFDRTNPAGRVMMCSTASVQVCLDAGEDGTGKRSYEWRWSVLHALGPVLVAAFANSPLQQGRPTGWRSTRQAVWGRLDPGRTRPPPGTHATRASTDLRTAWAEYALDAQLLCIRRPGGRSWAAPPGMTFREWLAGRAGRTGEGGWTYTNGRSQTGPNAGTRWNGPTSSGSGNQHQHQHQHHATGSNAGPGERNGPNGPVTAGRAVTANGGNGARDAADAKPPDAMPACSTGSVPAAGILAGAVDIAYERPPTVEDLDYHLSTLFPPVRPRGHFELRMIDAQPGDGWIVPVAVASALLDDPRASDAAMAAVEPLWSAWPDPWLRAARFGPSDPWISQANRACFEAAEAALGHGGAPEPVRNAVADFAERYVLRDRCPADDLLEEIA
ncbi:MAG: glutamate-cysteine ligase family protein [Micromonosporaceae bacterium]